MSDTRRPRDIHAWAKRLTDDSIAIGEADALLDLRRTIDASSNAAVVGGMRARNNGRYNGNGREGAGVEMSETPRPHKYRKRCDCRMPQCPCRKRPSGRCGHDSAGEIGMMRFCLPCMAWLTGRTEAQLREPHTIQLHDDGKPLGKTEWRPYGD